MGHPVTEIEKPLVDKRGRIGPNDVCVTQAADGCWVVSVHPIERDYLNRHGRPTLTVNADRPWR